MFRIVCVCVVGRGSVCVCVWIPGLIDEVDAQWVGWQLHKAVHGYGDVQTAFIVVRIHRQSIIHQTACVPATHTHTIKVWTSSRFTVVARALHTPIMVTDFVLIVFFFRVGRWYSMHLLLLGSPQGFLDFSTCFKYLPTSAVKQTFSCRQREKKKRPAAVDHGY